MIRNLTISYYVDNVNVKLYTETDDDNVPYNLADIFARVVKDSNANEEILIEQLKDNLDVQLYEDKQDYDSTNGAICRATTHK